MRLSKKIALLRGEVKKKLKSAPGCHDWDHTMRVFNNAILIASGEKNADLEVIKAAALLHDIARPEEMKNRGKTCHAKNGAFISRGILMKCGFGDGDFISRVAACIRKHRYRGSSIPETIEEKIIYDADKLDSIGAVGIGRAFHFAGRIGARLHNTRKEAVNSKSYSAEDSAYREYLVKLRFVPAKMLTKTGRKIAEKKAKFMSRFFVLLNRETTA